MQRDISCPPFPPLSFLWLEITGRCNLTCQHCYAESGPHLSHGSMNPEDWEQVLLDARELGCRSVQFIGGEPTLHPALPHLLTSAHQLGMSIEVYTNLVLIRQSLWELFRRYQVAIATSFYSTSPALHEQITRRRSSHTRTIANIRQVLHLDLPLRVGIIHMLAEQDIDAAKQFLCDLGVSAERIGIDQARSIGRGQAFGLVEQPEDALCGACARGKAAVTSRGDVYPCVFSRWLPVGNVQQTRLPAILRGEIMVRTRQRLADAFTQRITDCNPDVCPPDDCTPFCEPYDCSPDIPVCSPNRLCLPDFDCNPDKYPPCNPDTCNPRLCHPERLD